MNTQADTIVSQLSDALGICVGGPAPGPNTKALLLQIRQLIDQLVDV
jgi:hypothetical protein